jgi:hypothetical protein
MGSVMAAAGAGSTAVSAHIWRTGRYELEPVYREWITGNTVLVQATRSGVRDCCRSSKNGYREPKLIGP